MLTLKQHLAVIKMQSALAAYYPPVPCERCGELAHGTGMPLHKCDQDLLDEAFREVRTGELLP
jgi:hypothetical protein